jgi:DNA (cytosine-5)-methyltransferase 1
MKVLSLFSGVGGFDLGLEAAGMETVFQCEWDKHATSILERHWPDVPRWGDITTLTGKHILAHAPVIDVVAWGSPCQDLSVAGKRAGLEGSRSGLFHEGVRIIKELRKETNNEYPRISIWENVYGALNSNRGADFGVILNEMAEAGSLVQEWRVLDAQYFGVPQRRRRVFLISVFDSATAARCPDPLLPVSEGVQWHPATSNQARQTVTGETSASFGSGSYGGWAATDTAITLSQRDHKGSMTMVVGSLAARDYKGVGSQYVDENKVIVEPMVFQPGSMVRLGTKPSVGIVPTLRAEVKGGDNEPVIAYETQDPVLLTMREGKPGGGKGPLLSTDKSLSLSTSNEQLLFTPTDNPIVFDDDRRVGPRIFENTVSTLQAFMGTGGNNTPMVAQSVNYSFDTKFGSNAEVYEDKIPPLKASQQSPSIAFPIQDGRDIDKHQNGLGVADEGSPSYTIDQTGAQAVAYSFDSLSSNSMKSSNPNSGCNEVDVAKTLDTARPDPSCNQGGIAIVQPVAYGLQGNMIGRQDHNGPQGAGISHPDDPMFSLTSTDRHGVVQYDGYNQRLYEDDVSVTIRIGRDSSDFIAQPAQTTMAVRRLTPLECERLMGWPDGWTATKADGTPQSDTHRYKQCGNGIASPVAQWIAQQLLQLDKKTE